MDRDRDRDRALRHPGRGPTGVGLRRVAALVALGLLAGEGRAQGEYDATAIGARRELLVAEGRHGQALEELEQALERFESELDALNQSFLLLQIADLQRYLRRFDRAGASVQRVSALLESVSPDLAAYAKPYACQVRGTQGMIHFNLGCLELAAQEFEREQVCVAEVGDSYYLADAGWHLASLAMVRGDPDSIRGWLSEHAAYYDVNVQQHGKLLLRLGGAELERARREGSATAAAQATLERIDPGSLDPVEEGLRHLWLADCSLDREDLLTAREEWRLAGRSLGVEPTAGTARERPRWNTTGARLARLSGEPRAELEAWRERLRSDQRAFLDSWRAVELREGGWGILLFDNALARLVELAALEIELEGEVRGARAGLEACLTAQHVGSLDRELATELATLERVRAALVPHASTGLLVLLPGPQSSFAFLLDGERLTAHPLADQFALDRARQALVRESLASANLSSDRARVLAQGRHLGELLLPPDAREHLRSWRSVSVIGLDLLLGECPIEAVDWGAGEFFGLTHAVSSLPSASVGVALAERAARAAPEPGRVRSIADPVVDPQLRTRHALADLEFEVAHLEAMLEAYPARLRRTWTGSDATAERLFEATSSGFDVLQVLTHGVRDETSALPARIALAPSATGDGSLGATEVRAGFAVASAPELVVLAACRAGRGAARRGDSGASDLAGAFLGRGSLAVLSSAFDLDSEVARSLAQSFHREFARGASVAEALRRARRELLYERPEFEGNLHPLFVRAIGLGGLALPVPSAARGEPSTNTTSGVSAWVVALVLALCLGSLALSLRSARRREG